MSLTASTDRGGGFADTARIFVVQIYVVGSIIASLYLNEHISVRTVQWLSYFLVVKVFKYTTYLPKSSLEEFCINVKGDILQFFSILFALLGDNKQGSMQQPCVVPYACFQADDKFSYSLCLVLCLVLCLAHIIKTHFPSWRYLLKSGESSSV